jgi:NTP pyrophosphatase (non-canonical NTP hydrolase)
MTFGISSPGISHIDTCCQTISNDVVTPAQRERLQKLAEECSEVIQVVCKILAHGFDSACPVTQNHPLGSDPNRNLLENELGDVMLVYSNMVRLGDIDGQNIFLRGIKKLETVNKYLHHNEFQ